MIHRFEIAPPPHNNEWDKCVAFALPPAACAAAAVGWLEGDVRLGLGVGLVGFVGTFIAAWLLARSPRGYLRITETELQMGSGWMQARVALADLDLAGAQVSASPPDVATITSLVTDSGRTVRIPRRGPGEINVSVVEPADLIRALHQIARPQVAFA